MSNITVNSEFMRRATAEREALLSAAKEAKGVLFNLYLSEQSEGRNGSYSKAFIALDEAIAMSERKPV